MDAILASLTTSISEFKSNPSAALRKAGQKPFAVLTNNKPSFYVISPELYETISELFFEVEVTPAVKKRLNRLDKAISVDIADLRDRSSARRPQ